MWGTVERVDKAARPRAAQRDGARERRIGRRRSGCRRGRQRLGCAQAREAPRCGGGLAQPRARLGRVAYGGGLAPWRREVRSWGLAGMRTTMMAASVAEADDNEGMEFDRGGEEEAGGWKGKEAMGRVSRRRSCTPCGSRVAAHRAWSPSVGDWLADRPRTLRFRLPTTKDHTTERISGLAKQKWKVFAKGQIVKIFVGVVVVCMGGKGRQSRLSVGWLEKDNRGGLLRLWEEIYLDCKCGLDYMVYCSLDNNWIWVGIDIPRMHKGGINGL
uniref:Uncharacterized protein n=1 Tax=Oryza rufipogon TaxID=4529 RepID=A0A0E0PHU2_ORYRU